MTLHRLWLLFLHRVPRKGVFPSDLPGLSLTGETPTASKEEEHKGPATTHFSFMCPWPSSHKIFSPPRAGDPARNMLKGHHSLFLPLRTDGPELAL